MSCSGFDSLKHRLAYLSQTASDKHEKTAIPHPSLDSETWDRIGEFTYVQRIEEVSPFKTDRPNLILLNDSFGLEDVIFYDTETTGLSGGAGNIVFLIGTAWIVGTTLFLQQVFLSDYPGEEELLAYLSKRFTPQKLYVSYNGKSFDSHLLKTRFLLNGGNLEMPNQLDLLYIARRFWKRITGSCSLGTIEREVLGVERNLDIPSYEIPEVYFRFLRTGDHRSLYPVFEHNLQDIRSLVYLIHHIERILSGKNVKSSVDYAAVGSFLLEGGDLRGVEYLRTAFDQGDLRAGKILGQYLKREKRWAEALNIWQKMARGKSLYGIIELAKYYEHRAVDPGSALRWVDEIEPWHLRDMDISFQVRKRRMRLERKVERAGRDLGEK
jgi:uncharacterized protein YprB with RNaseH-like and TPR domain